MIGVVLDIAKATLARGLLFAHSFLCIYRVYRENSHQENYELYWLLVIPLILFVIEGIVVAIKRRGREYKWASPSFLFYIVSTVPAIWILEFGRIYRTDSLDIGEGVIGTDAFVSILEQLMLYVMIIGRWILPRGKTTHCKMTRDDLSKLIVTYISMASDITELFALLEQKEVKESLGMIIAILVIWTISILQFTVILTATHIEGSRPFRTDTWSIILNVMLQDLPFFIIRLLVMFYLMLLTHSIIAFAVKNVLIMAFLSYRLWINFYKTSFSHAEPI